MCIANPVSDRFESDVTQQFTEAELQRAEDIGLTEERLMVAISFGYTFEEILKMHPILNKLKSGEQDANMEIIV